MGFFGISYSDYSKLPLTEKATILKKYYVSSLNTLDGNGKLFSYLFFLVWVWLCLLQTWYQRKCVLFKVSFFFFVISGNAMNRQKNSLIDFSLSAAVRDSSKITMTNYAEGSLTGATITAEESYSKRKRTECWPEISYFKETCDDFSLVKENMPEMTLISTMLLCMIKIMILFITQSFKLLHKLYF